MHMWPRSEALNTDVTAQRTEVVRGAGSPRAYGTESPVPVWLGLTKGPSILQASVSLIVY